MTNVDEFLKGVAVSRRNETERVSRGVRRFLSDIGAESVLEFTPERGRRIDVMALTRQGAFWAIEVKSSLEDYRADQKWEGYLDWCDRFYFAVGPDFPIGVLPEDVGLIRADAFDAEILRESVESPLAAARRKALTLRFARDAASRLRRMEDPAVSARFPLDDAG